MDGVIVATSGYTRLLADIAANAERHDREASFPFENFERLRDAGLLSLTAHVEDGGAGAGLAEAARIVCDVGYACPSTALVLAMQLIHLKVAAEGNWPAYLRAHVARSTGLINALRVEPALGTPARGGLPETIARRLSDGWLISGTKIYSTGSPGLAWMQVLARTDEPESDGGPRVGLFLVPATAPGISIIETWDHLGLRASGSHDVVFDNVAIPLDHAVDLRQPAEWKLPDIQHAAWNTVTIAALYTGVARAARDWLIGFLHDRVPANLGASLATLPRMQEAVGAIEALLAANTRLIGSIAADYDRGADVPVSEYGLVKTIAAENAILAVEQAIKLAGNHGLSRSNPLERHLRDVLCSRVHTPQSDTAHIAAGRAALFPES
jgi:alkylation response protein AidB-like acyl-CoA dehydrogenase